MVGWVLIYIFKIVVKKKMNIILVKGYLGVGGQGLLEHRRMTREKRGRGRPHFLYNTLVDVGYLLYRVYTLTAIIHVILCEINNISRD